MKLYLRQIKPYIYIPMLQGFRDEYIPVDGYDWVPEDMEEQLREQITVDDPWSKLIFKERYVIWTEGIVSEWESVPIVEFKTASPTCENCSSNPHNGGTGICNCTLGTSIIY